MNCILPAPFAKAFDQLDTLVGMLAWQAHHRAEAICVEGDDVRLSFAELYEKMGRLAHAIGSSEKDDDIGIGLFCDPSVDLIVGAWGILASGHAYLPLAPEYPEDRIRYIIENSDVRTIVTQAHLLDQVREIAPHGTRFILIGETAAKPLTILNDDPAAGDLAYVIFTSGSTGRPKGVMVEHRSVAAQMQWLFNTGYLTPGDRILQKTPMSFDAAQWEILAPAVGATVVAGARDLYRDPEALLRRMRAQRVTTLQCVPTLLQALVEREAFAACGALHSVFSGGEVLSKKLAEAFLDRMPGCKLVNLYGPTECTINATAQTVTRADLSGDSYSVTIGRAVDGARCYLLDDKMRPVTVGQEGELYIGGVQVARGYLGRPDLTTERFLPSPFEAGGWLYRTGDICTARADGSLDFAGRADTQVKIRGYRVELEEIALAVEHHPWVRHAAAVVSTDPRSNGQILSACVELNDTEAAVMDQGAQSAHHRSKSSKLQVKAQMSAPGLRDAQRDGARAVTALPGAQDTETQRAAVFARKTYRSFEGGPASLDQLRAVTDSWFAGPHEPAAVQRLSLETLGQMLRWFGPFASAERLLPKYAYASPGALYATQLFVECRDIAGLADGLYYFHPHRHCLIRMSEMTSDSAPGLRVHFVGKKSAIEPVYKNNIQEVLEMETGHMLGVFEDVLGQLGHVVRPAGRSLDHLAAFDLAADDYYIGAFDCCAGTNAWRPAVELFAQTAARPVSGLDRGTYRVTRDGFVPLSDEVLQAKHVIAINQQAFANASVGFSAVSRESEAWLKYIALGWALHRFQGNTHGLGFMSSGYSSKTGNPLPAARHLDKILEAAGIETGPSYFFVGGPVSDAQRKSQSMNEDKVHMRGPAELIKDQLASSLPSYMIPTRVIVFDRLPLTANGKVDRKAVEASDQFMQATATARYVAPKTATECRLAEIWSDLLKHDQISCEDDFFAAGGNSLIALMTLARIEEVLQVRLPAQAIFETPTLRALAARIDAELTETSDRCPKDDAGASAGRSIEASRFVRLNVAKTGRPIFCWPGLGGYPMNLRPLAQALVQPRPFVGIQSKGVNATEVPFNNISEMAEADVTEIERLQPDGPVTLWGYSFGARLAFETAWQLENQGRHIDQLVLICPGNPSVQALADAPPRRDATLGNRTYVAILLSVFLGCVDLSETEACMRNCETADDFAAFVRARRPGLELSMIRRIMAIVARTYEFDYNFHELRARRISAPITIIKADGDDYSFIENAEGFAAQPPRIVTSQADHYEILCGADVGHLAASIHRHAALAGDGAPEVGPAPKAMSR